MPFVYPKSPKSDVTEDHHGHSISDPFRPLEDPHTEQTQAWIDAENKITRSYLDSIPSRSQIKDRLKEIWNYERKGVPYCHGDQYFYQHNDGMQNQPSLMMQSPNGDIHKLIDPNELSDDGTVALSFYAVSPDQSKLAYIVSQSGSDWSEIRVREIPSGREFKDHIKFVKFSGISWADDNSFFYCRFDEPNEKTKHEDIDLFQKLFLHRLGEDQSQDTLVYERPDDGQVGFGTSVTDDGKYLVITGFKGTNRETIVSYKDLSNAKSPIVPLIDKWESLYQYVGSSHDQIFFRTDHNAPQYRLVSFNLTDGTQKEVVAETDGTIETASFGRDRFFIHYLQDAVSKAMVHRIDGSLEREIHLPGIGAMMGLQVVDQSASEVFYSFENVIRPPEVYRYNIETGESSLFFRPKLKYNPDDFELLQEFYPSKDGTKVPMFITRKKGLPKDSNNPTILYGYGGFNVSLQPFYRLSIASWLELGGIYAMANLRGGGEYGEAWYKGGIRERKQNVFDDFISGAEHLIASKYTSSQKLAIQGGSNGGLLVGACMTQRPELFRAALPAVGVLDMVRFSKFTIGWAWVSDYGDPENAEDFKHLIAYSPLHNLKDGTTYPATLITTADHDDRVVPAHSFKFAARLQEAHKGDRPVLIRIDKKAGHGFGKPTSKVIEEQTDIYAFLMRELGME
jgi:prolyl oligopeptidase